MPWTILDAARSAITDEGAALWPERWPLEALQSRKAELDAVDVLAWSQEYLNRPLPSETQMFDPLHWPTFIELPVDIRVFQAWDLAISQKASADYTVGVAMGVDSASNLYLLDVRRGRWDFHRTQAEMIALAECDLYPAPVQIGIESINYQEAAVQEILRRGVYPILRIIPTSAQLGRQPGTPSAARGLTIPGDKVLRARLLEAREKNGKLFRPEPAPPWWGPVAEEFAFFPAGAHDDIVDSAVHCVHMIAKAGSSDWASAWHLVSCSRCQHKYQNPDGTRRCPKCGQENEAG